MRNKLLMGLALATMLVALSDTDTVKDMTDDIKHMM